MSVIRSVMIVFLLGSGWLAGNGVAADEIAAPAIHGHWVLNARASDSAKKRFKAFEEPPRGGFRQGGIGVGKNGRLNRGGDDGDQPDMDARYVSMRTIVGADSIYIDGFEAVTIVYDGEVTRNLVPNPHGRVYSASGQELVEDEFGHTLSFWGGSVLVVETTTFRSVKIVERYRADSKNDQLIISTEIKPSGRAAVDLVRVFDRAGP